LQSPQQELHKLRLSCDPAATLLLPNKLQANCICYCYCCCYCYQQPQGTSSPDNTCEAPNIKSTSSGCPAILLLFTAPITPSFCSTFPTLLLLPPPATLLLLLLPPLLLLLLLVVGDAGVGDWGSDARVEAAHNRLESSSAVMLEACGASCCMMAVKAWLC
jgi:hypothetical protein